MRLSSHTKTDKATGTRAYTYIATHAWGHGNTFARTSPHADSHAKTTRINHKHKVALTRKETHADTFTHRKKDDISPVSHHSLLSAAVIVSHTWVLLLLFCVGLQLIVCETCFVAWSSYSSLTSRCWSCLPPSKDSSVMISLNQSVQDFDQALRPVLANLYWSFSSRSVLDNNSFFRALNCHVQKIDGITRIRGKLVITINTRLMLQTRCCLDCNYILLLPPFLWIEVEHLPLSSLYIIKWRLFCFSWEVWFVYRQRSRLATGSANSARQS